MGASISEMGVLHAIRNKLQFHARRTQGRASMRLGRIGRERPLSDNSGLDRGTPIDRYYIERFLAVHSGDVQGHVLEVGDDSYSRRFGGARISRQDVLTIGGSNAPGRIAGDLSQPKLLPRETFDCIIITQTLQYVFDLATAIEQLRGALRPGGVLLLSVPGLSPLCKDDWRESFYWSFTVHSVTRLLHRNFDPAKVEVCPYGNLYAATAFIHGAALEEVQKRKLQAADPNYAITIAARAVC
jgi:SAM-dependent methyltransferase